VNHQLLAPLLLLAAISCGKEVGRVPVDLGGEAKSEAVALAAGTRALFAVHASSYSYSGQNHVLLHVELLKGESVVATVDCRGFELEAGSGAGCGGAMQQSSSCSTKVPAGGADGVRVSARLEDPSSRAEFEGLAVGLRVQQ
jgi:hypothetical protein